MTVFTRVLCGCHVEQAHGHEAVDEGTTLRIALELASNEQCRNATTKVSFRFTGLLSGLSGERQGGVSGRSARLVMSKQKQKG